MQDRHRHGGTWGTLVCVPWHLVGVGTGVCLPHHCLGRWFACMGHTGSIIPLSVHACVGTIVDHSSLLQHVHLRESSGQACLGTMLAYYALASHTSLVSPYLKGLALVIFVPCEVTCTSIDVRKFITRKSREKFLVDQNF